MEEYNFSVNIICILDREDSENSTKISQVIFSKGQGGYKATIADPKKDYLENNFKKLAEAVLADITENISPVSIEISKVESDDIKHSIKILKDSSLKYYKK